MVNENLHIVVNNLMFKTKIINPLGNIEALTTKQHNTHTKHEPMTQQGPKEQQGVYRT